MAGAVRTPRATVSRQLVTAMAVTALVLFAGLAVWLMVRRLSGAFSQPLSGMGLLSAAVAMELAALGLRRLERGTLPTLLGTEYLVPSTPYSVVPTVTVLAALASLTMDGTPMWTVLLAWLLVIGGEVASWASDLRLMPIRRGLTGSPVEPLSPAARIKEAEIPAGLVQKLTRVREGDRESIHVLASAEIPAGDRQAIVHVSFCPPLASRPELTAQAMDADDVEVRLAQAESFGARVEIRAKQDRPEPRSILIEVLGSVTSQKSA